jgi:multidrug efflux system membrane fusion protein
MDDRVERVDEDTGTTPLSRESPAREGRVAHRARRRGLILLALLIGVGAAVGWFEWTRPAPQPAPRGAQATAQPVGAASIGKGDIRIVLNELGTVTSLDTVTVMTQINGQLTQVGFKEGQTVKKGDFLAQIDPRPYQAALEQAEGQLAHDQGLLQQAQSDLKRYLTLGRQDSIAQQQVEDQRYLVAQYTGTVQSDQAQVDTDKLNLAYCHIVSPIDGKVGLREVDQGNYVQTSNTNGLVVIAQMQPISVIFSVAEDSLPAILKRLHDGATLTVEAYDRANVTKLASGRLVALDSQISTTTGTLNMRAEFDNADGLLYPNQFVNARLLVDTLHDVVRVPVPAVQRGEPGTFVYVIKPDHTVAVQPVKLGPTDGNYQAVLSGLQAGEQVVTDGTDRLRDGSVVTVPAQNQQQKQAPAAPGSGPEGRRGARPSP